MFLKSMELFGFKSFADRTKIEFEQGITVIVGPNGCGKSNIVDSVKWVLGEKQAKNIRGEKMEDVIFSGTESRKFLSIAEVSLAFNNETRFLGFDSDVVTVTRRVLRDGESEYLINKSPVRLKDIEQLFMDTGIGKSSYSVMEQGRIDMILSSRAEDRRYIFEEAAGVSRFKLQKKESLKKLIETGENLERINDIIHEIEREKDLKAKQAEKTKVYLSLKDEMKKNDIKLVALKNKDLVKRREKL
ncbi:MAG TPA: AAA family ATPase, partial [Spirochaetota bacterium]|nr:AAA family ATPase [Spirochaetota bacterium]